MCSSFCSLVLITIFIPSRHWILPWTGLPSILSPNPSSNCPIPVGMPSSRLQICPAAAAAKSLQSCLTLCDPIDSSPSGSSVPGILQARIMDWAAISFSNACMHAKLLQSCSTLLTLILEGNYQTLIFLSHLIFLIKLNFYIQIQAWFFQAWK